MPLSKDGEPAGTRTQDPLITPPPRLSPPQPQPVRLWSGPSLHHVGTPSDGALELGGRRLASTPSDPPYTQGGSAWLGIAVAATRTGSPTLTPVSSGRFRPALPIESQMLYRLSYGLAGSAVRRHRLPGRRPPRLRTGVTIGARLRSVKPWNAAKHTPMRSGSNVVRHRSLGACSDGSGHAGRAVSMIDGRERPAHRTCDRSRPEVRPERTLSS